MALIRDPNWDGPGPGLLIDDGTGTPGGVNPESPAPGTPGGGGGGRGQFTVEQAAAIDAAAQKAGGNFSGETQDYIDRLAAGAEGGATDTQNALNILIQQGNAKAASAVGGGDGDGGGGSDGKTIVPGAKFNEDVFAKLQELLGRLGLSGLTSNVRELVARGVLESEGILFELRETPQYKARFIANEARKKAGLTELTPGTYVALEQQFRETMRANGLDAELYDEQTDFRALIEGDVSNAELQRRINYGYRLVNEADPEVIRQMSELYKVTPGQLAQYFLDPATTAPVLEKQAAAAAIAARGKEQAKTQLSKLTAEDLVNRGYSEAQALAAFKILGEQKGLYDEMAGETELSQTQKVGAVFGYDVNSAEGIKKRAATRKTPFMGGGKFSTTTGSTSGTTQTGLGIAE